MSDLPDAYDAITTNTNKLIDVTTNEQIDWPSDISDISDATTDLQFNSEQESRSIFRLGHSDIWACEHCKQKGDVYYMRQHLCRGGIK